MTAHALDTLAIAGKLKAAGFSEAQAEAMTFVLRDAREADASNAATKGDVETVRTEVQNLGVALKGDMQHLRMELKADMQALELRLEAKIETANAATKANIQALELRLEARIEAGKAETIKWVVSAIGFQTIVLVGAVVALSRLLQT